MINYSKWLTASWNELITDACNEKAEYFPGTQCGYHPRMAWIVLGEVVRLIDGRRIEIYLEEVDETVGGRRCGRDQSESPANSGRRIGETNG